MIIQAQRLRFMIVITVEIISVVNFRFYAAYRAKHTKLLRASELPIYRLIQVLRYTASFSGMVTVVS